MISLPCTNCKKVLTIDEAFAGGVCRCQHCGAIQTVPRPSDKSSRSAGGRVLYQRTGSPSTDENHAPAHDARAAEPPQHHSRAWLVVMVAAIVGAAAFVVTLLMVWS